MSAFIVVTGGVTSYFSLLYVLPIVAATMLLSRRGGLMVAILSAVTVRAWSSPSTDCVAGIAGHPWPGTPVADLPPRSVALYTVALNIFGFFAVGWLSGSLAESLRRAGARLEQASSEIADLQAFNQHVIDSLTSGLVTTDYGAARADVQPRGRGDHGPPGARRSSAAVAEVLQLPAGVRRRRWHSDLDGARSRRADFQYRTAGRAPIEIGLSATHLLTPSGRAGFLFTFQDVTDIRRLERDARLSSGSRPSARWPPASRTRSATRSRRCPARSRCCGRSCRSATSRRS